VDTRVFLIHLFKLLIEALSKNAVSQRTPSVSQRTPSKSLAEVIEEVLEEAKADNLGKKQKSARLRKFPFDYTRNSQAIEGTSPIIISSSNELPPFWDMYEVQARQADREIKTGHGTIIVLDDYLATSTLLLRKDYLKEEFRERKLDLASLQALRKIGESAEKLKLSKDISDEKKVEVFNKTASHVQDIFEACQKGIPFEEALRRKVKTLQPKKGEIFRYRPKQEKAVQPPDLSKIPLWRGRGLDGRALDYLKTHYGQYLSAFGAEQNSVFQDQIRAHDPKLVQDLRSQLHEEGRGRKVSDFVKPRSARTERELETFDLDILKQAERIKGLLRRGRLKKEDLETFDLDILKQAERIKGLLKRRRHKEADT
jgi:hypothetical protein